ELADDKRAPESRAEALLEIVRLRCGAIQRIRRRVERRGVEALKHAAADLIPAPAWPAPPERTGRSAGAKGASAEAARPAAGGRAATRSRTAGVARRGIAEPVAKPEA